MSPVFDSLEFKPRKGAEHLEMRWCAYKYLVLSPAREIHGLNFRIPMITPKKRPGLLITSERTNHRLT